MDEAEQLAKDRRLYHLHAATFIVGFGGLIGTVSLSKMLLPGVGIWLVVGFAAILSISGVLAIIVGRTLASPSEPTTLEGSISRGIPATRSRLPGSGVPTTRRLQTPTCRGSCWSLV